MAHRQWLLQHSGRHEDLCHAIGLKPVTTPVTSPQSNGMVKSFVKILKWVCAKLAERPDSLTVMAQLTKWFDDYNSDHPHSVLGYVPANLFREK